MALGVMGLLNCRDLTGSSFLLNQRRWFHTIATIIWHEHAITMASPRLLQDVVNWFWTFCNSDAFLTLSCWWICHSVFSVLLDELCWLVCQLILRSKPNNSQTHHCTRNWIWSLNIWKASCAQPTDRECNYRSSLSIAGAQACNTSPGSSSRRSARSQNHRWVIGVHIKW